MGTEHAKVGETWWFALPVPANTTSHPIEITDVAVIHVPHGIKVLKYGAYSKVDTEGVPLLVREGGDAPDFARLTNHIDKPVKVAPGAESDIFYLAKLKITSPPRGSARECRFDYRQGDQDYTQTLDCEVELKTG
ncbi:hypothetical protein ADK65_19275 [Streptomyces sp. NRRL B-1140]|uniref:hypothetical protein n=1 Tax=Streptomyces sp. NRRL B-1140 TaxID=1415549 RepID=UPI0006AF2281|nr:hypothetical protein [Streptomyces sp. NRRL B-1140]KOV99088.1 hypothetical protein ADK65_19275 [Streptomyces sp. NRRL B-1140]